MEYDNMYQVKDEEEEEEWSASDESASAQDLERNYSVPPSRKYVHGVPGRRRFSDRNLRISYGRRRDFLLCVVRY